MEVIGYGGKVGQRWASKLTPVKDRVGFGTEKGRVACYAVFDGTAGDGTFEVELWRQPPLDVARQHATAGDTPELRVALMQIVGDAVIERLTTAQVCVALSKRGIEKGRAVVLREQRDMHSEGLINGKMTREEQTAGWVWWAR